MRPVLVSPTWLTKDIYPLQENDKDCGLIAIWDAHKLCSGNEDQVSSWVEFREYLACNMYAGRHVEGRTMHNLNHLRDVEIVRSILASEDIGSSDVIPNSQHPEVIISSIPITKFLLDVTFNGKFISDVMNLSIELRPQCSQEFVFFADTDFCDIARRCKEGAMKLEDGVSRIRKGLIKNNMAEDLAEEPDLVFDFGNVRKIWIPVYNPSLVEGADGHWWRLLIDFEEKSVTTGCSLGQHEVYIRDVQDMLSFLVEVGSQGPGSPQPSWAWMASLSTSFQKQKALEVINENDDYVLVGGNNSSENAESVDVTDCVLVEDVAKPASVLKSAHDSETDVPGAGKARTTKSCCRRPWS